jgi:hypothetical protein
MAWMDIPCKPAPLGVFFVSVFALMFFPLQGESPAWGGDAQHRDPNDHGCQMRRLGRVRKGRYLSLKKQAADFPAAFFWGGKSCLTL